MAFRHVIVDDGGKLRKGLGKTQFTSGGLEIPSPKTIRKGLGKQKELIVNAYWEAPPFPGYSPILWTPAEITTKAWFDAFRAEGIQVIAGGVSQWLDLSGNANNIIQNTSTNRPTYTLLEYLNFSPGLKSRLEFSTGFAYNWGAFSLFFVMASNAINQSNNAFFAPAFDYSKGLELVWTNVTSLPTLARINNVNKFTSGLYSNDNAFHLTSIIANNIETKARYDGNPVTPVDSSGISPLNFNGIYCLGAYALNLGSTFYGNFKIREFIITDSTVSQSNIEKIEGYLAHKWGLTSNLPAPHPYKSNAPII